jgi:hypothetical protein
MQCRIERKSQTELGFVIQAQLNLLCNRGFIPVVVHTDPHSTFKALVVTYPGTVIHVRQS